jgi:mannose-6-phosphate isomerase-like protein (cupin superfamily)
MNMSLLITVYAMAMLVTATDTSNERWVRHDVTDVQEYSSGKSTKFLEVLAVPAVGAAHLLASPDQSNITPKNNVDKVYIVLAGKAELKFDDDSVTVQEGSVIFVGASVLHDFQNIESELKIISLSSNAEPGKADPDWQVTTLAEARKRSNNRGNTWNRFFDFESLNVGLYNLPEELGGDKPLTHQVDEINVVIRGKAVFQVGDDQMQVHPGTIVWVAEGNPHYFHSLEGNFEVLIMFHQKPGVLTP